MNQELSSSEILERLRRTAWLAVALLWPVALLNYLDRQLMATMKKSIMADLPSIGTEEAYGQLMANFMWVYALLSPIGGFIADRFNRRWTVIASLAVWSLVTWLTGQVHNYNQLWWARGAMGVSEAFYMPAALALIADFHQGATRSRAVGIHQTGIYAGQALGGIGGAIADSHFGWRSGFNWFGLAGILYSLVLLFKLPTPEANPSPTQPRKTQVKLLSTLRTLFGVGSFSLLILYFTFPAMPAWLVKNWMPSVLADTFHLGQGRAGFSATLWVTIASFVGALAGGMLADRWMLSTPRGRIYASAAGILMVVPAVFGVAYAQSLFLAIAFLILFGIGWGFFDANNMPILCQIVGPEYRATGYGLMNMVSIGAGAWITIRMGALRDHGTPSSVIFSLCGFAAAASVIQVLLIKPNDSLNPAAEKKS